MAANFKLSKEKKEEMTHMIQTYFEQEQDEQIGSLQAMLILDFFLEKLAPQIYNQGIEDAHTYMSTKLDDIFEIQKY